MFLLFIDHMKSTGHNCARSGSDFSERLSPDSFLEPVLLRVESIAGFLES